MTAPMLSGGVAAFSPVPGMVGAGGESFFLSSSYVAKYLLVSVEATYHCGSMLGLGDVHCGSRSITRESGCCAPEDGSHTALGVEFAQHVQGARVRGVPTLPRHLVVLSVLIS